jgi:hypothetical protein
MPNTLVVKITRMATIMPTVKKTVLRKLRVFINILPFRL